MDFLVLVLKGHPIFSLFRIQISKMFDISSLVQNWFTFASFLVWADTVNNVRTKNADLKIILHVINDWLIDLNDNKIKTIKSYRNVRGMQKWLILVN